MTNTINILKPSACFEIQKIIGISTLLGNCRSYQVQWAPTWISGAHLIGCEDLIEQFEEEEKEDQGKEHDKGVEVMYACHSLMDSVSTCVANTDNKTVEDSYLKGIRNDQLVSKVSKNILTNFQESNIGLKVSSLDSIIQEISERNEKECAGRSSMHPDFQQQEKTIQNIKEEDEDYEEHHITNSFETDVGGGGESLLFQKLQNVSDTTGKILLSINSFDKCNVETSQKDENIKFSLKESSNCERSQKKRKQRRNGGKNVVRKSFKYGGNNKVPCDSQDLEASSGIHDGTLHRCSNCYKPFDSKKDLQRHILKLHSCCKICGKVFANMDELQTHVKSHKRKKEDVLECSYCEKRFKFSSHVELHERVHTGDRPHGCDICHMRFKMAHHLRTHLRRNACKVTCKS